MTKIDALSNVRNRLIVVAAVLFFLSLGTALSAQWWVAVFDYWLVWASFASGFGCIGTSIAALVVECERLDSLRNN